MDELTTILQLVVQQIHHQRTKILCPTSGHVEMLGSGIAMWQICCTASCRIIVTNRPLVVLYYTYVAGVRVVEFGTYCCTVFDNLDLRYTMFVKSVCSVS